VKTGKLSDGEQWEEDRDGASVPKYFIVSTFISFRGQKVSNLR